MQKPIIFKSILVVAALAITYFSADILQAISFPTDILPENPYLRSFLWRLLDYSVLLLVGGVLFWKSLPVLLGVRHAVHKSFGFALLCTLPMFATFPFFFQLNEQLAGIDVFKQAILPAVFEELAYRALVLGALFRCCHWKFLPAVLLNGVVFGLGHLYQANDLLGAFFTFAITFIGAVWFGWLYVKWGYNLYIPIFLHMLMNFSWLLFEVSPGAAGNTVANVARLLTILASIMITFYFTKQSSTLSWRNFKVVPNT
jgi:membrane protease YdiL (CAAX protease family)